MNKIDVVKYILRNHYHCSIFRDNRDFYAEAFAPINIALCKYWGKKDSELNIAYTSSISLSIPSYGSHASISTNISLLCNEIFINNEKILPDAVWSKNLMNFVSLFNTIGCNTIYFRLTLKVNVPISAGLASSSAIYASIILALNQLLNWGLLGRDLSILARLGSGSASRSVYYGFVEWCSGLDDNGMDSFAVPLNYKFDDLMMGLLVITTTKKNISSRNAMHCTVNTSPFYQAWINKTELDVVKLKDMIIGQNFVEFGKIVESNSLAMHATMLTSQPSIMYSTAGTVKYIQKILQLRNKIGPKIFFTQDAGANIKLIFLRHHQSLITKYFPTAKILDPFDY
ncbi:diphosphomevalonate decarboxylase [Rickettsia endosymbiont of Cardiosporidium cionae]|uniref:diphosphomevalonate decarboxylase n=1 Tax=Rickettsia endosymbiont of Cardiosporidium cionae TaxID=2777155 RepID=UPI00189304AA|nr:diphosphomevalonate decarboxylase [Rickettsia endosymbiont of Cardiosporidium cionae]KAF8818737.1 hypothetical protein IHI24_000463 [Rickettsia endosymbiont of Cardiosporidium cionae]